MNRVSEVYRKRYRLFLIIAMLCCVAGIAVMYYFYLEKKIPERIMLIENRSEKLDFDVPVQGDISIDKNEKVVETGGICINDTVLSKDKNIHFDMDKSVVVDSGSVCKYNVDLKLFGLFRYKNMVIDVVKEQKVMPSGKAVGMYICADGVMVLGTSEVESADGTLSAPSDNILQSGDYIYEVGGTDVNNINDVIELIQENTDTSLMLSVKRGKNIINVKVKPVLTNDGTYKIGAWLREDTEGIGTITYVTEGNKFAALGHGITDIDTGGLIDIIEGGLYPAKLTEVVRGENGAPGELIGAVKLGKKYRIGTIMENTKYGIDGKVEQEEYKYKEDIALEVGLKQEVKTGKAFIRCQLGEDISDYEIQIESIDMNSEDNKSMVLKVTDKRLLKRAGGIVQGMSGSPIIQNGKIIGAVTHVFVNNPTNGYGIFIEEMLARD